MATANCAYLAAGAYPRTPAQPPNPQAAETELAQAQAQLRNAVSIGEGSFLVFLQRPMSLVLLLVVLAVLVVPRLMRMRAKRAV